MTKQCAKEYCLRHCNRKARRACEKSSNRTICSENPSYAIYETARTISAQWEVIVAASIAGVSKHAEAGADITSDADRDQQPINTGSQGESR